MTPSGSGFRPSERGCDMSELVTTTRQGRVAVLTMNRPEALNALNDALLRALTDQILALSADESVGCLVLTGSEKAFAAGADLKEMAGRERHEVAMSDAYGYPAKIAERRIPMIAAVSGYALGGGCELAMLADMIFASETATFGQPEIKLAIMPGLGGTQRLVRSVGVSKAMDLVLTGRLMDAAEAERCGLVARVLPPERLMPETLAAAETIAGYSRPAVMAAKEAVDRAEETTLAEGLLFERRVFHALFGTEDWKEGVQAFVEKRAPDFKHR